MNGATVHFTNDALGICPFMSSKEHEGALNDLAVQ
jgi:hypothetical protein